MADGQHSEAIGAAARQRRVRGVRNIQEQSIQNKKEYSDDDGMQKSRQRSWAGEGLVVSARGDRRSKPAAAPRRPRIRTASRLKTAAPSSPTLGKAGADSQWPSREETNSVSSRRRRWRSSQRAGRRALAPHPRPHPLAEARRPRAPQAVKRLAGPPEAFRDDGESGKEKCQPHQRLSIDC